MAAFEYNRDTDSVYSVDIRVLDSSIFPPSSPNIIECYFKGMDHMHRVFWMNSLVTKKESVFWAHLGSMEHHFLSALALSSARVQVLLSTFSSFQSICD